MVHSCWFGTDVTNDLAAQGHNVPDLNTARLRHVTTMKGIMPLDVEAVL
jgi:hypothetical protein